MGWITIYDKEEFFILTRRCVPPLQLKAATASTMIDHLSALHVSSRASVVRLSGIVCTLGIASREAGQIEELIESGMNIACLNFAYGSEEYQLEILEKIRIASRNHNKKVGINVPIATALLTKGPVIRSYPEGDPCTEKTLYEGETLQVCGQLYYIFENNLRNILYFNYGNIHNVIHVGAEISIDYRRILLECISITDPVITCRIIKGGDTRSEQRVHLPGIPLDVPTLTEEDKSVLRFAIEQDIDIIFPAYIRNAAEVDEIRDFLGPEGEKMIICSQIEERQGVNNIDEIIKASDGILIGRGSLNNEIDETEVFIAQKSIASKCNALGKPVICSSDFFESMVQKYRPTRAEYCDLANAILDGVDSIMMLNEIALGMYPSLCVQKASAICKQAEAAVWQKQLVLDLTRKVIPPTITTHSVAVAAVEISFRILASAIVVISSSLKSAFLLTQYRPKCPIIAVTRNAKRARQAHLFRGIIPLIYKDERHQSWDKDVENRVYYGINFGRKKGFIKPGDPVVIMTASKQGCGFTDTMRILYVTKHVSHKAKCIC